MTHSLYRIRVEGRDHIPAKGGALFVCNHLSLIDGLLLQASTDRQIRFIIYKGIYERPWIKPFARILRAIPISSELRPREMIRSLREASEAIKAGESSASLPKARSRASARCCRFGAASSGS